MKINQAIIKKSLVLTLTVCVCAGSFSACGQNKEGIIEEIPIEAPMQVNAPEVLSIMAGDLEGNMNPFTAESEGDLLACSLTNIPLIETDRNGEIIFKGIEGEDRKTGENNYRYYGLSDVSVERNDDGSAVIDFKIREDVKFFNGRNLTADDVIFSIEAAASEEYDGLFSLKDADITSVEKIGDYEVKVSVDGYLITKLSLFEIPVVSHEGFSSSKEIFMDGKVTMGAGPYSFDRILGEELYLKYNPFYYKGMPQISSLILRESRGEYSFFTKENLPVAEYIGISSKRVDAGIREAVMSTIKNAPDAAAESISKFENLLPVTLYTIGFEGSQSLEILKSVAPALSDLGINLKIESFDDETEWKSALESKDYDIFGAGIIKNSPYYIFSMFHGDNAYDVSDDILKLLLLKYAFSTSKDEAEDALESLKAKLDSMYIYYELPTEVKDPLVSPGMVDTASLPADMTGFYNWIDEAEKLRIKKQSPF